MGALRRGVVIALLAVWFFPATSLAAPEPASPDVETTTAASGIRGTERPSAVETAELGAREREAQDLQDWRGGQELGVYFYVGSGLLLALIVVLMVVLI
jgi:hypothetical protein